VVTCLTLNGLATKDKDLYWFGQFSYIQNWVAFVLIAQEFEMRELQTEKVENVGAVLMLCHVPSALLMMSYHSSHAPRRTGCRNSDNAVTAP
jgi:hypothetical protein